MKKLLIVDDSAVIRSRIAELVQHPALAGLEVWPPRVMAARRCIWRASTCRIW